MVVLRRHLVVANHTLRHAELRDELRKRIEAGPIFKLAPRAGQWLAEDEMGRPRKGSRIKGAVTVTTGPGSTARRPPRRSWPCSAQCEGGKHQRCSG